MITLFSLWLVSRKKYPFDGSDREVIVAGSNPFGIAIDMESDHLYWLEHGMKDSLFRSDLDGSNIKHIYFPIYYPIAIDLDTVNK